MSNGVAHIRLAQGVDVAIECCAEQQTLTAWLGEVKNFTNDWHKAHVCHLVGFVEDSDFYTAQVNRSTISKVHQATRRCNEHVHATIKCINLLCVRHAACDQTKAKFRSVSNRTQGVVYLHGKFTGRNQDQAQWLTTVGSLAQKVGQGSKAEGQSLTGTSLGTGKHIAASDCVRQGCDLNSERLHDSLTRKGGSELRGNTKIGEGRSLLRGRRI
ncbi:unannotated protein [freshwater metagenome]|uniref:Unannotated protein n=1 Tax=freshwater metagenome TaxID=449393 RepID=A0A6J7SMD2_9ZZZZ